MGWSERDVGLRRRWFRQIDRMLERLVRDGLERETVGTKREIIQKNHVDEV